MANEEILRLDTKIQMFTDWMKTRKGKARDTATPDEICKQFKAPSSQVEGVMSAAHARGLVDIYDSAQGKLYILRPTL